MTAQTAQERIDEIEKNALAEVRGGALFQLFMLGVIASQLDRIATQLEKITSLKYTEDA